jgi:hypothetical protein
MKRPLGGKDLTASAEPIRMNVQVAGNVSAAKSDVGGPTEQKNIPCEDV